MVYTKITHNTTIVLQLGALHILLIYVVVMLKRMREDVLMAQKADEEQRESISFVANLNNTKSHPQFT